MLTLDTILSTTRQMTSFGERGTAGALDHIPQRVQGRRGRRASSDSPPSADVVPARRWDSELMTFVRD